MKCSIVYNCPPNNTCYDKTILVDGSSCPTSKEYLYHIWKDLGFPQEKNMKWDSYFDWMRDLSWIYERQINIVIFHFKCFLKDDLVVKELFLHDFINLIFPFWENNAMEVFQNSLLVKNITVYCIDGEIDRRLL